MSRFLTGKKTLPANRVKRAVTERERFEKTTEAVMRATGKARTESRVIPFRCGVAGRAFFVTFERSNPARKFEIVRIEKEPEDQKSGRSQSVLQDASEAFDEADFDCHSLSCPWCGDSRTWVHCDDCGETVCGGRVKFVAGLAKFFTCHDACGASGLLIPYDRIHGSDGGSKRTSPGAQLLPRSGNRFLKGPGG